MSLSAELASLATAIRQDLARWRSAELPPVPDPVELARREPYKLRWLEPAEVEAGVETEDAIEVDAARDLLMRELRGYVKRGRDKPVLLIRAQAGLGKTHSAVSIAQELALRGKRVLYLMPVHQHFETLSQLPHFNPGLWYHWRAYNHSLPQDYLTKDQPDETMCRLAHPAGQWMERGYPLMALCDNLCASYKAMCPFRCQGIRPEPIIAGVHEHVTCGLSIRDFYAVIVDEVPLRAFLKPRRIPLEGICRQGHGPLTELQVLLLLACMDSADRPIKGKGLLDRIGPVLGDVFAQFELDAMLPDIPQVSSPAEIDETAYWYAGDLLRLLVPEWEIWRRGGDTWLERVVCTKDGLLLLDRGHVWEALPPRMICLDATGRADLYRQMFNTEIRLVAPRVRRQGRLIQIVDRYNGKRQLVRDRRGGKSAESAPVDGEDSAESERAVNRSLLEAVAIVKQIVRRNEYKNPAVITFMRAEAMFASVGRTTHFYAQRGSNAFQDCDALFVVGTPSPADAQLQAGVAALFHERTEPFAVRVLENGHLLPLRTTVLRPYPIRDGQGRVPARYITGLWHDPHLLTMLGSHREDELLQSVHRSRMMIRPVDVYLLSSIPIDEPLDELHESPEMLIGCPTGMYWRTWLKLLPWLEQQETVSAESLAEAAGVSVDHVYRQRWLEVIAAEYSATWQIDRLRRQMRGRPPKILRRELVC